MVKSNVAVLMEQNHMSLNNTYIINFVSTFFSLPPKTKSVTVYIVCTSEQIYNTHHTYYKKEYYYL